MIKVITPSVMVSAETKSYEQGSKESLFMEAAGKGVAEATFRFIESIGIHKRILLLTTKGNNSGDAFVAGFHLIQKGCSVDALLVCKEEELKPLAKTEFDRYKKAGGVVFSELPAEIHDNYDLILDGLFGTGFQGTLHAPYDKVVAQANASELPIVAIDIPSGVEGESGVVESVAIEATLTLALGLPKSGFFLGNGWNHVGEIEIVPFGLPEKFVHEMAPFAGLLTQEDALSLRPSIQRTRHKYEAGLVVGLAGSPGMPGAALLSSEAVLRSGAGMIRLLHPRGMESELAASIPELIKIAYSSPDEIFEQMNHAKAAFVGPGIGRSQEMRTLLPQLFEKVTTPLVIDADALTLIAEENLTPPRGSLLTPHRGEMSRLLNIETPEQLSATFLQRCQEYVNEKEVVVVLKGGPTFILAKGNVPVIASEGTPGMATAGSGDVLTGILAGLVAQGLTVEAAACFGTTLHGLAGEMAAEIKTPYSMIAGDITHQLGKAYWHLLDF